MAAGPAPAPPATLGASPVIVVDARIVAQAGGHASLFAQADLPPGAWTYRWLRGSQALAGGPLQATAGTALPPRFDWTVEAGETALVLEVAGPTALVRREVVVEGEVQGISAADLDLQAQSAALAPLVELEVVASGGAHRAIVHVAGYTEAGDASFTWRGRTYPGRNNSTVTVVHLYVDRTLVAVVDLPPGTHTGTEEVPLQLPGGRHVVTAVAYQGAAGARLARVACAWVDVERGRGEPRALVVTLGGGTRDSWDFGQRVVGSAVRDDCDLTVRVSNTGRAPLNLVAPDVTGPDAREFVIDLSGFGTRLSAGEATNFVVLFRPSGPGARIGTLVLESDAASDPLEIELRGIGAEVLFEPTRFFKAGPPGSPNVVAVADLNGDRIPDVVTRAAVPGVASGGVGGFLGRGDGTFTAAGAPFVTATMTVCTLGDVDGDGNVDVCGVELEPDRAVLAVLPGRGDGTFGAPSLYPCPARLGSLRVVDLNHDGVQDVVGAMDTMAVFLGRRGASLEGPSLYVVRGGEYGYGTTGDVGDVDGDGNLDLIGADCLTGQITVHYGDGDGAFPRRTVSPAPPRAPWVWLTTVCDLDGDGRDDLILGPTGPTGGEVSVGRCNADGAFEFNSVTLFDSGNGTGPSLGDLDGDGAHDLLMGGHALLGLSTTPPFPAPLSLGLSGFGVVLTDLNCDGRDDVLMGDSYAGYVYAHVSTTHLCGVNFLGPERSFAGTVPAPAPWRTYYSNPPLLASGDVDGDGHRDVVTATTGGADVAVLFGSGDGTFPECVTMRAVVRYYVRSLGVADVDGDGRNEVLVGSVPSGSLLRASGRALAASALDAAGPLWLADLDHDGRTDVVSIASNAVTVRRSAGGVLGAPEVQLLPAPAAPNWVVESRPDDLDGDGWTDLPMLDYWNGRLLLLRGTGGGGLALDPTPRPEPSQLPGALATGDFDDDGLSDLLVPGLHDQGSLHLGFAGSTPTRLDVPVYGRDPAVADVDHDGHLDVVALEGWVAVSRGHGDGTFRPRLYVPGAPYRMHTLGLVDLNGDGLPDVVGASVPGLYDGFSGGVSVRLGR